MGDTGQLRQLAMWHRPLPPELAHGIGPVLTSRHPAARRSREEELRAEVGESRAVASQLEGEVASARAAIEDKERRMLELEKQASGARNSGGGGVPRQAKA